MCGIAGYHRRGDAEIKGLDLLAKTLLLGIESRGRDATGVLGMTDDGAWTLRKKVVPAHPFTKRFMPDLADARTVLLHTRWATVGRADDPKNAHPVTSGTMAAVHNGTISNATELFQTFGLTRKAEVDSEVIPAIVSHAGWDKAADALKLLSGGAAIALVDKRHPRELLFARTRSYPLVYVAMDDLVVWASTEHAIMRALASIGRELRRGAATILKEAHMVRLNGAVGEQERFMPDPVYPAYKTKKSTPIRGGAPATTRSKRVRSTPNGEVPVSKAAKKRARRRQRGLAAEHVQRFPDVDLRGDDSLAQDIAIDILVTEGYSLEEAAEIVRGECEMAEAWRRDWDDSWQWDGDVMTAAQFDAQRPAWHAQVYGGRRVA